MDGAALPGPSALPNTVKVCRPGRWRNAFPVLHVHGRWRTGSRDNPELPSTLSLPRDTRAEAQALAVDLYRQSLSEADREIIRSTLRGQNLACRCRLDVPCHADVLLAIANG
jgi:hypothetical protein